MKSEGLIISGKRYVTTREAAKVAGYAPDYVGQLCRAGKLDCTSVGRSWFVAEESVIEHKKAKEQKMHEMGLLAATAPRQPLLPKEAKQSYFPVPRQLVGDIAGVATVFALSLGFAWSAHTGVITKKLSHVASVFMSSVRMELPSLKEEAQTAAVEIPRLIALPGKLTLDAYDSFITSAARGSALLGGSLAYFSAQQFIETGFELGDLSHTLLDAHLAVVEAAGPALSYSSEKILNTSYYAINEAGAGLALLVDSLLNIHQLAIKAAGESIATAYDTGGRLYLATIDSLGGTLASVSHGLLEKYAAGIFSIGDGIGSELAVAVPAVSKVASRGVGSLLALHATLILKSSEGLDTLSVVPMRVYSMLIDNTGELVATLSFGVLETYARSVTIGGNALATVRDGLLDGYMLAIEKTGTVFSEGYSYGGDVYLAVVQKIGGSLFAVADNLLGLYEHTLYAAGSGLAHISHEVLSRYEGALAGVADRTGTAIEPTVSRMAVIFDTGLSTVMTSSERYLGALAVALPQTVSPTPISKEIALDKEVHEDAFDEVDALVLDMAIAREEIVSGFESVTQSASLASLSATLSIDGLGYAGASASYDVFAPARRLAVRFYRTLFAARLSLARSFDGMFAIIPEQKTLPARQQGSGVVVTPSLGTDADAAAAARIRAIFSDEVEVRPNNSGVAGVVTPVFKNRTSKDFLYVLVPVKE